MERRNEAQIDIEVPYDPLFKELDNLFPMSPLRCIYRVPKRLREKYEKAYTPQVVSIGPLHHGKEHLRAMEEHKKRYLRSFINRTKVSFDDYINKIKEQEPKLGNYYAEFIELSSDQLVRIVLVDAAFIIEYLLRNGYTEFQDGNDYMFHKPWMRVDVSVDLLMLENQLPFFILKNLFEPDKLFPPNRNGTSIIHVCFKVFKHAIFSEGIEDDLLRTRFCEVEVNHLVDFLRILSLPLPSYTKGQLKPANMHSMTELHQAGVKLKVGLTKNLFDIRFATGTLEIPKLEIHDNTEVIIRNLVAFEQCHYEERYISDYVIMMDYFMNTREDVELLAKCGIVENLLGDTKKVSTLINNLGDGVAANFDQFYFAALVNALNLHCGTAWNKSMANLKQNYFNTPWAIISFLAAVFLLVLTIIQTVSSVLSIAQ